MSCCLGSPSLAPSSLLSRSFISSLSLPHLFSLLTKLLPFMGNTLVSSVISSQQWTYSQSNCHFRMNLDEQIHFSLPLYSYPFLHCLLCIHFFRNTLLVRLVLVTTSITQEETREEKCVSIFSSYFSPLTWRSDFKEWNMFSTFFLPLFIPSRFSCLIIIFHAFLSFHTPFSPLSTTLLVWWSEKMNE